MGACNAKAQRREEDKQRIDFLMERCKALVDVLQVVMEHLTSQEVTISLPPDVETHLEHMWASQVQNVQSLLDALPHLFRPDERDRVRRGVLTGLYQQFEVVDVAIGLQLLQRNSEAEFMSTVRSSLSLLKQDTWQGLCNKLPDKLLRDLFIFLAATDNLVTLVSMVLVTPWIAEYAALLEGKRHAGSSSLVSQTI